MSYETETSTPAASGGSPASLDYVNAQTVSLTGDTMTGPLAVPQLEGAGTAPVVAGVTHCVASAAAGHDLGGSFTLTTDSTSITGAATIATVTFGNTYAAAPVAVLVQMSNTTSGASVTTIYATVSATVLTVKTSASLAASDVYTVNYVVITA